MARFLYYASLLNDIYKSLNFMVVLITHSYEYIYVYVNTFPSFYNYHREIEANSICLSTSNTSKEAQDIV